MRFTFFTIIILGLFFLNPHNTNSFTEEGSGLPITVELNPADPGPNQNVRATLRSYSFNLSESIITWEVNGAQVNLNERSPSIVFKTGDVGSVTVLKVTTTINNQQGQKIITIRPADTNLVWQTNSTVPNDYLGKPLASVGSEVEIIAIPNFIGKNGASINPKSLIYEWEKDHQKISTLSGLGKDQFKIKLTPSRNLITVKISTSDREISSVKSITITPAQPKVIFYENHPLAGMLLNKSLGNNLELVSDEISIQAEPFYFSSENIVFNWLSNNKSIDTNSSINNRVLFGKPSSAGESQIKVIAENKANINQKAEALINILFNKNTF